MREQMKNENEFRENGNLYIKKLKRCSCCRKENDEYILSCWVIQRGTDYYRYKRGEEWISRRLGDKRLWLDEEAKNTVIKVIDAFDNYVNAAESDEFQKLSVDGEKLAIFYRPVSENKNCDFTEGFDFILKSRDIGYILKPVVTEIKSSTSWWGILHCLERWDIPYTDRKGIRELLRDPTKETIHKHPLVEAANKAGLVQLEKLIRIHYGLADYEDCAVFAELTGERILPALSEEYDQNYVINATDLTDEVYKLLQFSGYRFMHRPYFALRGYTKSKFSLNPHVKTVLDAAKEEQTAITFEEYLKLFETEKTH